MVYRDLSHWYNHLCIITNLYFAYFALNLGCLGSQILMASLVSCNLLQTGTLEQ